ncbi:MAG: hypothetical protein ACLFQV_00805 [Vulcanimicrobiota bacterium]
MFLVDANSLQRNSNGRVCGRICQDTDDPSNGRYALVSDYIGSIPTPGKRR